MTSEPNAEQLEIKIEKIYKDLIKEKPLRKKPTREQIIGHLERINKEFEEGKIVLSPPVR
jgi:hypothetical protein